MTSDNSQPSNLAPDDLQRKRYVSGIASKAEIRLMDLARMETKQTRSQFMVNASIEKARRILGLAA